MTQFLTTGIDIVDTVRFSVHSDVVGGVQRAHSVLPEKPGESGGPGDPAGLPVQTEKQSCTVPEEREVRTDGCRRSHLHTAGGTLAVEEGDVGGR